MKKEFDIFNFRLSIDISINKIPSLGVIRKLIGEAKKEAEELGWRVYTLRAIRKVRDETGCSLYEAKVMVESAMAKENKK